MPTEDRDRHDREDSIQPTADTEIEMETSTKLPPRIRDVLLVENFHTSLANVQIGLTHADTSAASCIAPTVGCQTDEAVCGQA